MTTAVRVLGPFELYDALKERVIRNLPDVRLITSLHLHLETDRVPDVRIEMGVTDDAPGMPVTRDSQVVEFLLVPRAEYEAFTRWKERNVEEAVS